MRIYYASHDQGTLSHQSLTWYHNLYQPLCDIADEVVRFNYDLFPLAQHQDERIESNRIFMAQERPKMEEALLEQIKSIHQKKPIDLLFSYFASSYCSKAVIEEIKNLGILTVNWFCNASYQFYLIESLAPAYDYCLVPEYFRLKDYKAVGANPVYCQEAANANFYKPLNIRQDLPLSFVGSRYGDRTFYLRKLYNAGCEIHIWGDGWKKPDLPIETLPVGKLKNLLRPLYWRLKKNLPIPSSLTHGFASDDELVRIFNRSKINLGFSTCGDTHLQEVPVRQVRLRDFEVPMSGGFYLTQQCEELAQFFDPDKEIVFFDSPEELIDKAGYYLKNEQAREKIRQSGMARARREHTWQGRLRQAFAQMPELKKVLKASE